MNAHEKIPRIKSNKIEQRPKQNNVPDTEGRVHVNL